MNYAMLGMLFFLNWCSAISVVYNLRIAEITKRQANAFQEVDPGIGLVNIFDHNKETYDHIHQNFFGGMATLMYLRKKWYGRIDWAAAHASSKFSELHFSRTQTDDVLITTGYGFSINKKMQTGFSLIVGFPTHKDSGFEEIQFGVGHYGAGVQWDGVFRFTAHLNHFFCAAVRFIRFFKSHINFDLLPIANRFTFTPGNLSDVLVSYNVNFNKQHIEIGYNATFLHNPSLKPLVPEILDRVGFIRSSFYASWGRLIALKNRLSGVALALSYGFDHSPKDFGVKWGITVWGVWGVNF